MSEPYETEFWQEYNQMMQTAMDNMQNLLNKMGANAGGFVNQKNSNNNEGFFKGWVTEKKPGFRIDQDRIAVIIPVDKGLTKDSIQIYLEGNNLFINGALQENIALPVAVLKYGGKAALRNGILEVVLVRDKYTVKQHIPIDAE